MSSIYDNWERLVHATLKREQLREIALCESFSSIASSDFSFDSFCEDVVEASIFPSKTSNSSYNGKGSTNSLPTEKDDILSIPNARPFSFNELKYATRNFQPEDFLAQGSFNRVYKGWIDVHTLTAAKPGCGLAIAVKMFELEDFNDCGEWLTEVNYLGQLHHPNLVKLIGYCSEGDNRLLVYEFMPKGSLEHCLFRSGLNYGLSWDTRINVAMDVARGLLFLHDRDPELIHGDVKCPSILLDGDFSAKLSGFTLTKLGQPFNPSLQPGDSSLRPPYRLPNAYDAPEYIVTGVLTAKCDVYSFGVVLLELLCGRCAIDKTKIGVDRNLVDWAKQYMDDERKLFRIMNIKLEGQYPKRRAYTVATLALQCVSSDPERRPHMEEVLDALERVQDEKLRSQ